LASLQGEAGNYDVATGFDSSVDNIAQLFLDIQVFVFFMRTVAVSRLDNYIFRRIEDRWVIDYGALWLANIPGKQNPVVFAVLLILMLMVAAPRTCPAS